MAFGPWWSFSKTTISADRNEGAVYEFGDFAGNVIYLGSTNALRRRLTEHLEEDPTSCINMNARHYRYDYRSDFAKEAQRLHDEFVRENGQPPHCNPVRSGAPS
jgi:hypothetical protein